MLHPLALVALLALGQAPIPRDNDISHIAPGTSVFAHAVTVSTSTTTYLLRTGTSATKSAYLAIADGSVLTVHNLATSGHVVCCWSDGPVAQIGDVTAVGTAFDVTGASVAPNGNGKGACFTIPFGRSRSEPADHRMIAKVPGGGYTSMCSTASTFDRAQEGIDIYPSCLFDAHCASVAGVPGGATCLTSASAINRLLSPRTGDKAFRGLYLGCRASVSSPVHYENAR